MWSSFPWVEARHTNRLLVSQESKVLVHRIAVGLFWHANLNLNIIRGGGLTVYIHCVVWIF